MDFISLHIQWVKNHPSFIPKGCRDYSKDDNAHGKTYVDTLIQLYRNEGNKNNPPQWMAEALFKGDLKWFEESKRAEAMLIKSIGQVNPTKWFITFNFNHQTFDVDKAVTYIKYVISKTDFIVSAKCKFEMFRTNGEHPHCHCIMVFDSTMAKSTIAKIFWNRAGGKKLILKSNFIDVLPYEDRHDQYINGIKHISKMDCVNKDIVWRKNSNIPEFIEK